MYQNILNDHQRELLPLIQEFSDQFYLVGGTAIALQIGHRKSIDFDLFSAQPVNKNQIKKIIDNHDFASRLIFEDGDQLHITVNNVKITFYEFPYPIQPEINFNNIINMPSLLSLSAMKAYALQRRAKWKDYVDMYFLLKEHFSLQEITKKTQELFGSMFNTKLLYQQLSYFDDINYSEQIEFIEKPENRAVNDEEVKKFLTNLATTALPFSADLV